MANTELECFKSLRVLPFGRNKDFVGREYYVNRLMEIFRTEDTEQDCQRVALDGLGGVGKTQIALELAFRIQESSPEYSVFWVRASDAANFEGAYREIGQRLKIPGLDNDKADVKELVRTRLSQESAGKWLLIVDNADDFGLLYNHANESSGSRALHEYLPFSPLGAILFTTRDREAATRYAGSNVMRIEEMNEAEARKLLKTGLQNKRLVEDGDSATKLLKLLANLPLAIMQAVAYLNAKGATIAEYLKLYEESSENIIKLLSKDFEDRRRYPGMKNPVATTWLISFEQIQLRDPLAADYMAFMSCIKEQDIPRDLLPPAPQFEGTEAIGTLKAFGFIKERPNGNSYDMHRLVHIAMQSWLKLDGKLTLCRGTTLKRIADAFPWPVHENRGIWTVYLPHAQCIITSSKVYRGLEESQWRVLDNVGECFSITGKYAEAEQKTRQALQLKEQVLGTEHLSTLATISNLAAALSDQGKHVEAKQLHRQVLQFSERVLGAEHPFTLSSINDLAVGLGRQGKHAEAEKLHQQALQLKEQVLSTEHPSTLDSMNNLAVVLGNQGKHVEAEQLHRQALQLRERVLGVEHPSTLISMNNLGIALGDQGKHVEAEQLFRQVLQLKEQILGTEHPSTLATINSLAEVLYNQGKHVEAEQLHRQVLQLRERVLGTEHPSTLKSIGNLTKTLSSQGKHEEAEQLRRSRTSRQS
jgi:tetratricopeptide (TPR) repeat protein